MDSKGGLYEEKEEEMKEVETNFPRLYIVMFKDVPDMNPGKGMAQAAHAATMFMNNTFERDTLLWMDQGEGNFGTKIVLSATKDEFKSADFAGYEYGIVVDPTYPIKNWYGEVFTREEETCGYVFVTDESPDALKEWELHQ